MLDQIKLKNLLKCHRLIINSNFKQLKSIETGKLSLVSTGTNLNHLNWDQINQNVATDPKCQDE